jgi:hypothetical protein
MEAPAMSAASTASLENRTSRGLSAPIMVGGAFVLSTVANICFQLADILFTDNDPHRAEGPIDSIVSISIVGVIGLIIALAVAVPLHRNPARARIGAIVLGALALVTTPFFWSGAPAVFGAAAAWLGGLTKGAHPQTGVARGFGIVGFVVAILVVVATFVGSLTAVFR